jgi:hypothetical protein
MNKPKNIQLLKDINIAETTLHAYRSAIGSLYEPYLNHIRRVLTYANWFQPLHGEERRIVETALAFHDVGFWTDHRIDYLLASSAVAKDAVEESEVAIIEEIIKHHHRWSRYRGPFARLVEPVRKADWIDVSSGYRRFGMPKRIVDQVENAIPELGFRKGLLRAAQAWPRSRIENIWASRHLFFPK